MLFELVVKCLKYLLAGALYIYNSFKLLYFDLKNYITKQMVVAKTYPRTYSQCKNFHVERNHTKVFKIKYLSKLNKCHFKYSKNKEKMFVTERDVFKTCA